MSKPFFYIVFEINSQRLFVNCDGDLTDLFDHVMRFPDKGTAQKYLNTHPRKHGRADIIGMSC